MISGGNPSEPAGFDNPSFWLSAIAASRDLSAFSRLFVSFGPKLKANFLRLGETDGVAEELTQETMLMIWRKADLYDASRNTAVGWIYTVARNLRIDMLRRERLADGLKLLAPTEMQSTPEELIVAVSSEERVRAALGRLPTAKAKILRLSFFDEFSHTEIARQLGIPLGTVKSRLKQAAADLRSAMGEDR